MTAVDAVGLQTAVEALARDFAASRSERQQRRHLEPLDFKRLADAGFLLTGVSSAMGGLWIDLRTSTRSVCESLRVLAKGDPSVALVSAMHPGVLGFWLIQDSDNPVWREQQRFVGQTALDGAWWGTIASEPGTGGALIKTRAIARHDGADRYRISGQKHFGSGSGITSYMITSAIPEGEEMPEMFYLDVRDVPWDGSKGMQLVAEWDGHGMTATQSHAFEFQDFPATRFAPRGAAEPTAGGGVYASAAFSAVITGTVQSAVEAARGHVLRRKDELRAYELTEWANVEQEAWLIDQAYEGVLTSIEEQGDGAGWDALLAKTAISQLAESATRRICTVTGGGSYNRSSHFGAAFEDVRALGFLRPPWGLAYDQIIGQALTA